MSEITLRGISKRYADGTTAVDNVDLDIQDGEFVILVGPSGCGKSTLLRMIVGLEDISEGDLSIGGNRVNTLGPKDRNLAMVFQNYALYPHLSVRENIAFPLRLAKMEPSEIDQRVGEAARVLELGEFLDRKPAALSGGQRQRVAMGRAIVREPAAFLFDEPLSNLDAKLRVQMRTEIARLQKRYGTTTVYVTHDQTEAMTLGDRVAVLRKGIMQQVGSPRELYNNPVNLFVAGFIGSPSMNFLPGQVRNGKLTLPMAELDLPEEFRDRVGKAGSGGEQSVIVGIRPEHFEDASMVSKDVLGSGVTFRSRIDVIEWMGSELYAYIPVQGSARHNQGMAELARELDQEDVRSEGDESQIVARLDPASRVRESQESELWLDARRLHLFEPETGASLTYREGAGDPSTEAAPPGPSRGGSIGGTAGGPAAGGGIGAVRRDP